MLPKSQGSPGFIQGNKLREGTRPLSSTQTNVDSKTGLERVSDTLPVGGERRWSRPPTGSVSVPDCPMLTQPGARMSVGLSVYLGLRKRGGKPQALCVMLPRVFVCVCV